MSVHHHVFQLLNQPMLILSEQDGLVKIEDANEAYLELVGKTLDAIKQLKSSTLKESYHIDLSKRIIRNEIIQTRNCDSITVRIEQLPLPKAENNNIKRAFIIFEDLSAQLWINEQQEKGKVLISGIVDKHLQIRFFRDLLASFLVDPDQSTNDEHLLQYIADHERQKMLDTMEAAAHVNQEQHMTLQTSKLGGVQLEFELTFIPILNGFCECKQFAFVIWDFRPTDNEIDSAMKLKIWMAKRDMSTGQLSAATGISQQTISKLRNGKIEKPQRLTAELIASELQVDVHEIWTVIRK
ncbi:helix-turn-helix transcriptional regulator [Paenibacillus sp. GSMTC-2017]|uniref:helix-turn-helix domain-containing protein n=1 Tax=Paenibacillus sp. GSMTC-2017 TaxID=2794350 RepID=UPI0018D60EAE|nr:helix-turn-helix transcriptional regulator [Paenibacillus sp. GSMTC-2017]MBH5318106.1 helix-turn-helix transcriptional regulator [Paenibacillus sp. GSMTC-2017]